MEERVKQVMDEIERLTIRLYELSKEIGCDVTINTYVRPEEDTYIISKTRYEVDPGPHKWNIIADITNFSDRVDSYKVFAKEGLLSFGTRKEMRDYYWEHRNEIKWEDKEDDDDE